MFYRILKSLLPPSIQLPIPLTVSLYSDGQSILTGSNGTAKLWTNIISFYNVETVFNFYKSNEYHIPFNYQTVQNAGYIWEYGRYYQQKGQGEDNLELAITYLDTAKQVFDFLIATRGEAYLYILASLYDDYGEVFFKQGEFLKAAQSYEKEIEIKSTRLIDRLHNIATIYVYSGEYSKAESIYLKYKDKKHPDYEDKTWNEVFLRDLILAGGDDGLKPKDEAVLEKAIQLLESWIEEE